MKIKLLFLLIAVYLFGCGNEENVTNPSDEEINEKNSKGLIGWGLNDFGQLGNKVINSQRNPNIIEDKYKWKFIAAGYGNVVAIQVDGSLWAWGLNAEGQLGNGNNIDISTPIKVLSEKKYVNVACGYNYTIAIQEDGSLWAWGGNSAGQLGNGNKIPQNVPIQIGNGKKWKMLATGRYHSAAIAEDGSLWAWGLNHYGQIGTGEQQGDDEFKFEINTPFNIKQRSKWKYVTAGDNFTLAIAEDGSLWAWGENIEGQLGLGTKSESIYDNWYRTPFQIGNDKNWKSVAAGKSHSLGLKEDGSLWAWGGNSEGQLGNSSNNSENYVPQRIGFETNWSLIYAKKNRSLAIKKDSSLKVWGDDEGYNLGIGEFFDEDSRTKLKIENKWGTIAMGDKFTVGIFNFKKPIVVTIDSVEIKTYNVWVRGEVLSDGGTTIIKRGIVYGKSNNPTIENSKKENNGTLGYFECYISDIETNTDYYARAFATNLIGTSYGKQIKFRLKKE